MLILILANNKILGITIFVKLVQAILILFLIFNLGRGPWTTNHNLCVINSGRSMHWDHNNEMTCATTNILKFTHAINL